MSCAYTCTRTRYQVSVYRTIGPLVLCPSHFCELKSIFIGNSHYKSLFFLRIDAIFYQITLSDTLGHVGHMTDTPFL